MAAAWASRLATPEAVAARLLGVLWFVSVTKGPWGAAAIAAAGSEETLKCEDLKLGQYICKGPKINDATQEPVNCTNYTAHVPCFPAPNITCKDFSGNETHFTGSEVGFLKPISCRNVNGYSYKVAVALSLFLGWLGADRFYLGYPALGLLKFCTVGFCGIGSLIDFILISMQIQIPEDPNIMASISAQLFLVLISLLLVLPVVEAVEAGDAIAVLLGVALSITGICACLGVYA